VACDGGGQRRGPVLQSIADDINAFVDMRCREAKKAWRGK
jgi:hypothetical protein